MLLSFLPSALSAIEAEFILGGNYTKFTDSNIDEETYGIAAKCKINFYSGQKLSSGPVLYINMAGGAFILSDFTLGYGIKNQGDYFLEAIAGASYSILWGSGLSFILSGGFHLNKDWYINIPIIYRSNFAITIGPLIGMRF